MKLVDAILWIKISLRFVIIGIVLIIMSYYGYVLFFKKPPNKAQIFNPDYACGQLPKLQIKTLNVDISKAQIVIPSESSILIDIPPIAYVYPMIPKGETFSTKQRSLALAKALQFSEQQYTKPNPITLKWEDAITQRILTVNTQTLHFVYTYLQNAFPRLPNTQLPPQATAPTAAQNTLASLGLLTDSLQNAKKPTTSVYFKDGIPHKTNALINAHAIRVDFQKPITILTFPKALLKIEPKKTIDFIQFMQPDFQAKGEVQEYSAYRVSDKPNIGNVRVYIKSDGGDLLQNVLRIEYQDWQVDSVPCGTYPLMTPAAVLQAIQTGHAYLVNLYRKHGDELNPDITKFPEISTINIYNLELSYLENDTVQRYLQPIYVAYGEVTFVDRTAGQVVFYVPAIEQQFDTATPSSTAK